MNFAGGSVYTYFKYVDSQQTTSADVYARNRNSSGQLRYDKAVTANGDCNMETLNGHCIQDAAGSPVGTVNMV